MKKQLLLLGAMASVLLSACSSEEVNGTNNNREIQQVNKVQVENKQNAMDIDEEKFRSFDDNVATIEKKAEEVKASESAQENNNMYSTIVVEIEQIENEMDQFENQLEADFLNGSISKEDYYTAKGKFEQLENRLDVAEDSLEIKFRIDD